MTPSLFRSGYRALPWLCGCYRCLKPDGTAYPVDMERNTCGCYAGSRGIPCKHRKQARALLSDTVDWLWRQIELLGEGENLTLEQWAERRALGERLKRDSYELEVLLWSLPVETEQAQNVRKAA